MGFYPLLEPTFSVAWLVFCFTPPAKLFQVSKYLLMQAYLQFTEIMRRQATSDLALYHLTFRQGKS